MSDVMYEEEQPESHEEQPEYHEEPEHHEEPQLQEEPELQVEPELQEDPPLHEDTQLQEEHEDLEHQVDPEHQLESEFQAELLVESGFDDSALHIDSQVYDDSALNVDSAFHEEDSGLNVESVLQEEENPLDVEALYDDGLVTADDLFSGDVDPRLARLTSGGLVGEENVFGVLSGATSPPAVYDNTLGPPETGVNAQIVLIITSLGSFRRQFFASKRAQHFLDCKGLTYNLIDTNRDVSQGMYLIDQELIVEWDKTGLLAKQESEKTEKLKTAVPQILIDGVYIGDGVALQDMEDDGDLDWVAVRASCPSCMNERDPNDAKCRHCDVQYMSLIPEEYVATNQVQRFCRGLQVGSEEGTSPKLTFRDTMAQIDHDHDIGEDVTYESLFGEPPPPES